MIACIVLVYAVVSLLVGLPLARWIASLELTADVEPVTDAEIEHFLREETR
jgi:hypothetical protein